MRKKDNGCENIAKHCCLEGNGGREQTSHARAPSQTQSDGAGPYWAMHWMQQVHLDVSGASITEWHAAWG